MDIGNHLKQVRSRKNISVYRLAVDSGISESHIRNLESGKKQPTFYTLKRLLDCIGVSLCEFFYDGASEAIYPSSEEMELIMCYCSLDEKKQRCFLNYAELWQKKITDKISLSF